MMMDSNGSTPGEHNATSVNHSEYWKDAFVPLQHAGKAILQVMRKDETSPHGDLYRRILSTPSTVPTTSGEMESIPNHHYFFDGGGRCSHKQSIPLPAYLQDQLAQAKVSNVMGLFEQAQMAWMTIDDTIYVWSYNYASMSEQTEFLHFRVPSHQPIISAGLARPKPGVFREMVEWCLVVTTKEEAMLCALARKDGQGLSVIQTKFVIPSDWISFLSVVSTSDGRIFLGGQDGNLYELDYDLLVKAHYAQGSDHHNNAQVQLDQFYDGPSGKCPAEIVETNGRFSNGVLSRGKRLLETMVQPTQQPPRKCRKLNHSQSSFTTLLPDFINNIAQSIFGDSTTTGGGPIIQMIVDDERQILYTLSTRGWICALDIADKTKVQLSAVLNTPVTARLYLELVSRGKMYPPSTSGLKDGIIMFPGGGDAAQAGVGGMEGARKILKFAEQAKSNGRNRSQTSLLTPVSIQIVPSRESTRITLVAITAAGLRYYLSTLSPNTMSSGPITPPFGTPRSRQPWRPYARFTFCHIRAPPPTTSTNSGSQFPSVTNDQRVDATCYRLGVFFAAVNKIGASTSGNIVVATTPDSVARVTQENKTNNSVTYIAPGGVCEVASYPMSTSNGSALSTATLPGGRIWDICSAAPSSDKLLSLALHSRTPTDNELGFSMVPAYVPPAKRSNAKKHSTSQAVTQSSTLANAQSFTSLARTVFTNIILSRPTNLGVAKNQQNGVAEEVQTLYRISRRTGENGFSISAGDSKSIDGSASTRSARLSPWLLTPDTVPLSPMALQHLETPSTFLALNAGGMHFFQSPSILQQLLFALSNAGANARSDPAVTKFFENYGYAEGCAMCLVLAMKPSTSADLKEFAVRAAMSRAYRPALIQNQSQEQQLSEDPWVPTGYVFKPSAIYEGLTMAISRILRPFWHKPLVVVTEGRILKLGSRSKATPAKVELLLDDDVLERVLASLHGMREVIEHVFSKAVESVPLAQSTAGLKDDMEIDDDNHYLSRALEYQRQGQSRTGSSFMRASDADEMAQRIEERNIHSLFRLASRTSQLLSLYAHLKRAQSMPDLPEVNWGQMHGISVAQFVQSREGHERMESVLNSLVAASSMARPTPTVSADAKRLAQMLSEQCYHFFSAGSRFAYFGFQAAHDALALPSGQRSRKVGRALEAVENLKQAAMHWFSPSLISGRILQTKDSQSYNRIAERAIEYDSPLAKACALLMELEDVASVVDLCLLTASNFKPGMKLTIDSTAVVRQNPKGAHDWEKGLYNTRLDLEQGGASTAGSVPLGPTVTAKDALDTCFALVFYHLTALLSSPPGSRRYQLGEKMVSVCAAAEDSDFLHKFYEHLLKFNFTDVLLRVDSRTLESWLAHEQKDKLDLLLRYYQVQDKNLDAGNVALTRATEASSNLSLDDRIENLVYAVDSFERAARSGDGSLQEKLKQSNERLEIARLQRRVLQTMTSTKFEVSDEDLKPLKESLLSANVLLNKYAIPYDMYECCLLILHVCQHTDSIHVQQFWKSLLCEEVFPCVTRSEQVYSMLCAFAEGALQLNPVVRLLGNNLPAEGPLFEEGAWLKGVAATVVRFGREVLVEGESFVFPVEYVALCLEDLRRTYGEVAGAAEKSTTLIWTYDVLVAAGIGHMTAINAYEHIVATENHSTMGVDPARQLEQLQTIISMLESFVVAARSGENLPGNSASQQMKAECASGVLFAKCEDYRSRLQSLPGDVSLEERRLSSVEASLRLFTRHSF